MRGTRPHLRAISQVPAQSTTALELKLDAVLVYFQNGILLANSLMNVAGSAVVNTTGFLATSLPYKNATGGSSQGGGDTGGDTGGDDDGGIL
ncbi:MAG: hypothetical protein AMXMBFR82_22250 [Candidatus Hydrogenedentota bacterium]